MTTRVLPLLLVLTLAAAPALGEDVFVGIKGFHAGLHQDKAADSPILKLVPAGATLQVLKREALTSLVRDSDGVQGWIDNSYLATEAPSESAQGQDQRKRIEDLERQLGQSRTELTQLEARFTGSGKASEDFKLAQQLKQQNQDLEQQLKQEKLRGGEAQVELTEVRKRIGMNSDTESLYQELAGLQAENKQLRINVGEKVGAAIASESGVMGRNFDLSQFAATVVILLLLGLGGGVYLMDYLNRRRHGGFRV
jgi:hypothetical protein